MRALLDTRPASDRTGIGRYARTIQATLCGELGAHRVWSLGGVGGELRFAPLDRAAEELELPAHLVRESIDLYHSPLFRLPACLPCRSVITIHDAIPLVRPDLSDPRFTALFHAEAKSAVERADRIVCPSDAAKGDLVGALSIDEGKVAVIPESPDPVFRPLPRESTRSALERMGVDLPYVLVVGRVEHRKNPHAILDAVGLLPEGEPLVVFVGPLGDVNLPAEVTRRGIGARVRWLGQVTDEDLCVLYNGAHCLVFPSLYEGFGLPIVEAFACGTPVIASAAASIPEVAGDAAILVDPLDHSALADAMKRVASSESLRQDLRARGLERAKDYTSEGVRARFLALYDEIARIAS